MRTAKAFALLIAVLLALSLTGCAAAESPAESTPAPQETQAASVSEAETPNNPTNPQEDADMKTGNQIRIEIGEHSFTVTLAENASAAALMELLADGPRTISCSNYGGFEKVCQLGARLPSNDVQTRTVAGDVMLYSSNQIVIFYDSNSWAYTRLGTVDGEYIDQLEEILSGPETELTLSLVE